MSAHRSRQYLQLSYLLLSLTVALKLENNCRLRGEAMGDNVSTLVRRV